MQTPDGKPPRAALREWGGVTGGGPWAGSGYCGSRGHQTLGSGLGIIPAGEERRGWGEAGWGREKVGWKRESRLGRERAGWEIQIQSRLGEASRPHVQETGLEEFWARC